MTPHRRYGASRATYADPAGRRALADRWIRKPEAGSRRARTMAQCAHPDTDTGTSFTAPQLEELWDRHGRSVYALACVLLGDETAAAQAVTLGMTDLARSAGSASIDEAHLCWVRNVYWRSQEFAAETASTTKLPPAMSWLGQLAHLQRACLALCLFGGLNYREAAGLLGVAPLRVADLLTSGLREMAGLVGGEAAVSA